MNEKKLEVPEQSGGDVAHSIVKAGLSAIPVFGGTVAELFQNVMQSPIERRRGAWRVQVGERLQKLEETGFDLETLQENEQFISAVMYASQLALRTHEKEKLVALCNAIVNIAKGQAPEDAMQHIFLNLIDMLTELHIQILKLFQAPTPPPGTLMGGLGKVLEYHMPEMRGQSKLYKQLWKDLYMRGLVTTEGMNITMDEKDLRQKRTTELGDMFLGFIENP